MRGGELGLRIFRILRAFWINYPRSWTGKFYSFSMINWLICFNCHRFGLFLFPSNCRLWPLESNSEWFPDSSFSSNLRFSWSSPSDRTKVNFWANIPIYKLWIIQKWQWSFSSIIYCLQTKYKLTQYMQITNLSSLKFAFSVTQTDILLACSSFSIIIMTFF